MKTIQLISILGTLGALGMSVAASATPYIVGNAKIEVYSGQKGIATLVRTPAIFSGGEHPWCKNSLYIAPEDTDLRQVAVAAALSGRRVNIYYEDAAPEAHIPGHIVTRCRIFSIWF